MADVNKETIFRDPVLNSVVVKDQLILDLIGTTEFQRLRRIKQLGSANSVFHGAEHSRFSHSLGVYEIARRFSEQLAEFHATKVPGDGLWDPNERIVLLSAALLHDLGHGPYSHTFEHIFGTNHEDYTRAIITEPGTQINTVLKAYDPELPQKVADVINKTYANRQVVQLISSQIDADRMDYLLRDAYYTGATYGEFDLSRIIQMVRPYEGGIAFEEKGLYAIEDYVVSRYQMYVQVYFHPVSRSLEILLTHLLERAQYLFAEDTKHTRIDKNFISPALQVAFKQQESIPVAEYLCLDDNVLLADISQWRFHSDPVLADLATRFIDRHPLKSIEVTDETRDLLPKLRELINDAGFESRYYTAENDSFDQPYSDHQLQGKSPKTQIELMAQDGTLTDLSTGSAVVSTLMGRAFGDARFFFPKEMLQTDATGDLMADVYVDFQRYVRNGRLIVPTDKE